MLHRRFFLALSITSVLTGITSCASPPAERPAASTPGAANASASSAGSERPTRPRPPLAARSCGRLSPEELQKARDYLHSVTRVEPLFSDDAFAKMQQRSIIGKPGVAVGVKLYLPAEYGMNRAYLERLLTCHAVQPPRLDEHPNDPLLTAGIIALTIDEASGGEYEISILTETRQAAKDVVQRAQAILPRRGSVRVEQLAPEGDASSP